MKQNYVKWLYLGILAIVWGSSFILMKRALIGLTPVQLGALRIIISAIFLLIIGFPSLRKIKATHWKYIAYSAVLGTFFPAFMFAFAIDHLDSAIVAILNSFTPFNTLIFGVLFFGFTFYKRQVVGLLIGLLGAIILILKGAAINPTQNYGFALLIILASTGYAMNVNIIKKHLQDVSALSIATGNFILMIIPACLVLYSTGFLSEFTYDTQQVHSLGYVTILAILGTGIAKVLFNKMVHIATPVFASSVTYLIPIVAVFWGVLDGERLSIVQLFAGFIILLGVYLVNKKS